MSGAEIEECLARCRRGLAQFHAAARKTGAAARSALIGSQRGIAFDHGASPTGNAKFLGDHLAHGDAQTGSDIHFAGIDRHGTIGMNGQKAIELVQVERFARSQSPGGAPVWASARKAKPTIRTLPRFSRSRRDMER